jgi:predicted hydrolase (HD superfamily)
MEREVALNFVKEYVKNQGLINHMLSVEAAMRFYAEREGQDIDIWGITGLLHDFDWEIHPSLEQHPKDGGPILRELHVPEEIVHAILTHGTLPEYPRQSRMEKALFACDEITGLITAVALVRPSRFFMTWKRVQSKRNGKIKRSLPAQIVKKWNWQLLTMGFPFGST